MENQEDLLDVLTVFEKKPSQDIPPVLEDYLNNVAKTGKTLFPWNRLKPLFISKLEQVMEQLNKDMPYDHLPPFPNVENLKYEDMKKRIIEAVQRFNGAPFTVQRICELVTDPKKHYTRCDKFLRGIEKNVMVVSTVDPSGRKIVSESSYRGTLVNGLDLNGFSQQKMDSSDINDGQPFAPVPLTDWSSNSLASVWPLAMGNGTDTPKPSFTEQSSHRQDSADVNVNNNGITDEVFTEDDKCDSDVKYTGDNAESTDYADDSFVHKDKTSEDVSEGKESEVTTDSAPNLSGDNEANKSATDSTDALNDNNASFNFETKQSDIVVENVVDSTDKSDDSSKETGESADSDVSSTRTKAETEPAEAEQAAAEETESGDNSELEGPPEKKMRMTEPDTDLDDVSTSEQVDTDRESNNEAEASKEQKVESIGEEVVPEPSTESTTPVSDNVDSPRDEGVEESIPYRDIIVTSSEQEETLPQASKQEESAPCRDVNVTSSEQEETSPQSNKELTETEIKDGADTTNESSNVDSGTTAVCKEVENTVESDTDNISKVDTTSIDDNSAANEAMETEQDENKPSVENTEISEVSNETVDETEPMDQE